MALVVTPPSGFAVCSAFAFSVVLAGCWVALGVDVLVEAAALCAGFWTGVAAGFWTAPVVTAGLVAAGFVVAGVVWAKSPATARVKATENKSFFIFVVSSL